MKYLLDVTFYAGSDEQEDTDRGLYLLKTQKNMTETEIRNIFREANRRCSSYNDDNDVAEFPTYDNGLNIYTLIEGVKTYMNGVIRSMKEIESGTKLEGDITYYQIEQWQ